jgi:hypothetical protein
LAGIPQRVLSQWILRGRAGDPLFVEFVDMLDQQLAEMSSELLSPVVEAARSGNLQASMWIYNTRVKPFEDHAVKKLLAATDAVEQRQLEIEAEQDNASADDLAAQLMQQMTAGATATELPPNTTEDSVVVDKPKTTKHKLSLVPPSEKDPV